MKSWHALPLVLAIALSVVTLSADDPTPPPKPTPVPVPAILSAKIICPENVEDHRKAILEVDTSAQFVEVEVSRFSVVSGQIVAQMADIELLRDSESCDNRYGVWASPGTWNVVVRCYDPSMGILTERATLTVGKPAPVDPTDPIVDPVDPTDPVVDVKTLRVLIVEESSKRGTLPSSQSVLLTSRVVADKLTEICGKDANGQPLWRILDKNASIEDPSWKAAMALPRQGDFWLHISDGTHLIKSIPLPSNQQELFAILDSIKS